MFKPLLLISSLVLFFFVSNLSTYLKKTDYALLKNIYGSSQWVNPSSQTPIGDADLYAFAGLSYLKGIDPTILNPEMPPLGKYLIGLIALILGNQNYSGLIFGTFTLFAFYLIAVEVTKNNYLSFFATLFLFSEKIFREQLTTSLLDLPHLFFLLFTLFSFLKTGEDKRWFIVSGLSLGGVYATKVFFVGILTTIVILLSAVVFRKPVKYLFIMLSLAAAVYLLSYLAYFLHGATVKEFLGLHKYIVNFYKNSLVNVFAGAPFYMLLFGRWETWFGKWFGSHTVVFTPGWSLTWLIITLVYLIELGLLLTRKIKRIRKSVFLLLLWLTLYLLFLFNTPMWPRYLLLVIPFMYLTAFDFLITQRRIISLATYPFHFLAERRLQLLKFTVLLVVAVVGVFMVFGGLQPLFTSSMARDWYVAERIYRDRTVVFLSPSSWILYIPMAIIYLLFDGHPVGFIVYALFISLVIILIFLKLFGLKFGYVVVFLSILVLGYKYHLFGNRQSNSLALKMTVTETILSNSQKEDFGIKTIGENDYSYPFLFHRYGVRSGEITIKDIDTQKPKLIYLIFPNSNLPEIESRNYIYGYYGYEIQRLTFPNSVLVLRREL